MKKISLMALALTMGAFSSVQAGFYGSLGAGMPTDIELETDTATGSVDSSLSYSLAVGYEVPLLPLRVEVESLSFRGQDGDISEGMDYSMNAFMVNAYAGLPLPFVTPYIGAGIGEGTAAISGETSTDFSSGYKTAYQAMAGVELSIPLLPFSLGVEYRYFTSDAKDTDFGAQSNIQSVLVKARLQF